MHKLVNWLIPPRHAEVGTRFVR